MSFAPPDPFKAKLRDYLQRRGVLVEEVHSEHHTVLDLSGAAQTLYLLMVAKAIEIKRIYAIYQEASSADAGVDVEIGWQALSGGLTGRTTDRNGIATYTSEASKSQWNVKELTLTAKSLRAGEILTLFNTGGKTGTGALWLIIQYESAEA